MKIIRLLENILLEASKKDILINKIGLSDLNAEVISNLAGPLSVWIANKLIDHQSHAYYKIHRDYTDGEESLMRLEKEYNDPQTRKKWGVDMLNKRHDVRTFSPMITSIMDWIRVGLNGNVKPYQDRSFNELNELADEWHKNLNVGAGEINYVEKNEVIRDYRNEDGIGFYWVNLGTNDSSEECDRMGHCGRTNSYNTIYSLRENRQLNRDYTINKSHLTAAVGNSDGIIYQLKGPKNSKPDERYNQYIVDLILNDEHIQGFGSEYNSSADFNMTDLPKEEVVKIYEKKPELFNTYKLKSYLKNQLGVEGIELPSMEFELEIEPGSVHYYIEGDWVKSKRPRRTPAGNTVTEEVWFTETILSGDIWDLFDSWDGDWQSNLEYHVDEENAQRIRNIIQQRAGEDYNPVESLGQLIDEYDDDWDIRSAINSAYSDCASQEYYTYVIQQLKSALEEYGEVTKLNDEGAVIKIDLKTVIDNIGADDDEVDDAFERCDDDPSCVFNELMGDYYDKPRMRLDDRWYPTIDEGEYNSILSDRLYDIE